MTGYRSQFFRESCTDSGCYIDRLPDWGEYIECFPRNIRPTDVDGMVEIRGRFLFMEEKRAEAKLEEGQRRALLALSRLEPVTVVFFRPGHVSDLDVLVLGEDENRGWQPHTRDEFREWLRDWADRADATLPTAPSTAGGVAGGAWGGRHLDH